MFLKLRVLISMFVIVAINNAVADTLTAGSDIKKCHYNDEGCVLHVIQFVLKTYGKTGNKTLGLLPLDPLRIKRFRLAKNMESAVSIDMSFNDVDLFGLQDAQIKYVSGFDKQLKKPLQLSAFLPKVTLKGPYHVDGRVLILPIVGKGIGQFVLENMHFQAKLKVKPMRKFDDKIHAEVVSVHLQMEPGRVIYKLDGLFHGQKDLSDNMHAFINENWQDIFNELKPDIAEALGLIMQQILNSLFSKYAMQDLFLENFDGNSENQ